MHARNLATHGRAELAGIYDVDSAASAEAARATGSRAYDSVDALLGDGSIEAVLIATSTDTHCELIERSARAGKAVLCEKPIHLDIRRVDECAEVVESTGARVQIGFNRRFDPSHAALGQAAASGEIGSLGACRDHEPRPGSAATGLRARVGRPLQGHDDSRLRHRALPLSRRSPSKSARWAGCWSNPQSASSATWTRP